MGKARDESKPGCRCLRGCLTCIEDLWFRLRAVSKRRRPSYKLYFYHSIATGFSVITFGLAVILYVVVWSQVKTIKQECPITSWNATTDAALKNRTLTYGRSVLCDTEPTAAAACELVNLRAMLDFMLLNGIVNGIQLFGSCALCRTYLKFSNLPQERMHFGRTSRAISCGGCVAKWFPWVTRFMHLFQMFALWTLWGMIMDNTCRGDLSQTAACLQYRSDCAYYKQKNCQYYYVHCDANETNMQTCLTQVGRAKFSGRMDIRLLTVDACARCQVLKADLLNPLGTDEFYLLDETDRTNPLKYVCLDSMGSCFYTTVWGNIACRCESFKAFVNLNVSAVQTWWTGLTSGCTKRRLEDAASSAWAEDTGRVMSLQLDSLEGNDVVASPFASSNTSQVARRLAEKQQCSWAPQTQSDYFYDSDHCDQGGSFVYRFGLMYIYVSGSFAVMTTLIGQTVRLMAAPEPWFVNPNAGQENIIKKLLRWSGP